MEYTGDSDGEKIAQVPVSVELDSSELLLSEFSAGLVPHPPLPRRWRRAAAALPRNHRRPRASEERPLVALRPRPPRAEEVPRTQFVRNATVPQNVAVHRFE